MDFDFGYNRNDNSGGAGSDNGNGGQEDVTNLQTGKIDHSIEGAPADNLDDVKKDNIDPDNKGEKGGENADKKDEVKDDNNSSELVSGTTIEVGDETYTVDNNGNVVDKDGNIFKETKDVKEWLASFDKIEDNEQKLDIATIQNIVGIDITDENDKPIEFDNTPEGVKAYIDAVIESAREEHYETAINTLYQKYPILSDVLNYYVANGNSLEGFNEMPDRSGIIINEGDEAQQEAIIRTAWKEQGRKGDIDGYIQYLKSSGTLYVTANQELAGLQEADEQYRKDMAKEAEKKENERIEKLEKYWNSVRDVINSRKIAGYQIPESIIINRNGQKLSVTPNDFFNYIYRVDQNGKSAYQHDLENETAESRRDDRILRAYLKFTGGNYSNLVNMAINNEKVNTLRLTAKQRNKTSIRINKPVQETNKDKEIDLGY